MTRVGCIGLCWWWGCRYCCDCLYGWRDGVSERGCIHDRVHGGGVWRFLLMIVMQRHLGGGLRRPNRGKIGGKARGRRRVAFSVVQGRLADDGRTSVCFCETFMSY